MKSIVSAIVAASLLLTFASLAGIVGFRYPHVVEDEPLKAPIEVLGIEGNHLYLADFRVVKIRNASEDALWRAISDSDFCVDIEGNGALVSIHARKDGWLCGNFAAQPIRIPIIAETVYINRREMIAIGELVDAD